MTPDLSRIKPAKPDPRFPYLHKKERRYLARRKIKTIEQLADRCDHDVLAFKGCGPDSVKRITWDANTLDISYDQYRYKIKPSSSTSGMDGRRRSVASTNCTPRSSARLYDRPRQRSPHADKPPPSPSGHDHDRDRGVDRGHLVLPVRTPEAVADHHHAAGCSWSAGVKRPKYPPYCNARQRRKIRRTKYIIYDEV